MQTIRIRELFKSISSYIYSLYPLTILKDTTKDCLRSDEQRSSTEGWERSEINSVYWTTFIKRSEDEWNEMSASSFSEHDGARTHNLSLRRRVLCPIELHVRVRSGIRTHEAEAPGLKSGPFIHLGILTCLRRGSNPGSSAHKTDALPTKLRKQYMPLKDCTAQALFFSIFRGLLTQYMYITYPL